MDTINIECKKFVEQNFNIQTGSEFFQRIYKLQTKSKWCKKVIVILYYLIIRKLIKIAQNRLNLSIYKVWKVTDFFGTF